MSKALPHRLNSWFVNSSSAFPMMTPALRTSCRFALPGLLDEANNLEFLSNIGADMLVSAIRRHGHERVMEPPPALTG
jgi:hypothetical protein